MNEDKKSTEQVEEESDSGSEDQVKIYELGFHIIPTIPEENLGEHFGKIKKTIENNKGSVFAEQAPQLRRLAYTIVQKKETGHLKFDDAYFGWVKFEGDPEKIKTIEEEVSKEPAVLRVILVKTLKETTLYGGSIFKREEDRKVRQKKEDDQKGKEVSETELDKSIETLVGANTDIQEEKDPKADTPESVEQEVAQEEEKQLEELGSEDPLSKEK